LESIFCSFGIRLKATHPKRRKWCNCGLSSAASALAASASAASRSALACIRRSLHSRFLAPTHVGLVTFPGQTLLPCDRIASRSVLQAGSIREDGQAGPVEPLRFQCRCDLFLDRGGCVQGGRPPRGGPCFLCRSSVRGRTAVSFRGRYPRPRRVPWPGRPLRGWRAGGRNVAHGFPAVPPLV